MTGEQLAARFAALIAAGNSDEFDRLVKQVGMLPPGVSRVRILPNQDPPYQLVEKETFDLKGSASSRSAAESLRIVSPSVDRRGRPGYSQRGQRRDGVGQENWPHRLEFIV